MRKVLFISFLLSFSMLFGQSGRIAAKVQGITNAGQEMSDFQVFTKSSAQKTAKYINSATDVSVLDLNEEELNRITGESPEFLTMSIPYSEENIEVTLYKQEILSADFKAVTESGEWIDYNPGIYYRGIVSGDENSLVAVSFFENDVMGVVSTHDKGNIILGKSNDKQDFITYSDKNLLGTASFECGVDELEYNQNIENQISFDPSVESVYDSDKCVKIYYEIANNPYIMNGSSLEATLDWITGIQNNISTLYDNDGVNMLISTILVWTIEDPYDAAAYSSNLYDFVSNAAEFDGDLAHLINYPATTSVAFLDSLCSEYAHAYSAVDISYEEVPVYSWTIMAMTHEMGHSLGSPHTHACAWNGDNSAIDGCGPAAGYGDGCDGPIPEEGGTIMSYCHLNSVGINLLLGFGEQPGALIRNNIESKSCLSTDCTGIEPTICAYSIEEMTIEFLDDNSIKVSLTDTVSSEWKFQLLPYGQPLNEEWETSSLPEFVIDGLENHQYYNLYAANVCEGDILGGIEHKLFLTGDFCDGTPFTDTGGPNANYGDMEYFEKTFYPSSGEVAVELDFMSINLENNWDFLYVYNGDSINSSLFQGGALTGNQNPGPAFVSTHESGAITVKFESDMMVNRPGWSAIVNCAKLGIEDFDIQNSITVYPNPATDILNIVSQKAVIESAIITDLNGRVLLRTALNGHNEKLDIGNLAPGIYLLNLKTKDKTITKKVIKR